MPPNLHVTTPLLWMCISILLVINIFLILLVRQLVNRTQFRQMRWWLVSAGGIFFLLLWTSVLWWGWDWFYAYIFPAWGRYLLPPIFAVGYALLALGMVWLSLKLPGSPAVTWGVLGGVEGLLSHIYAIFGLGAASKPPIMQGSDPFVVLVFAVFEKALYWILILLGCSLLSRRIKQKPGLTASA
jgi:hypothetical protein